MNYEELSDENKKKALNKAKEYCTMQIMNMGCNVHPETNRVWADPEIEGSTGFASDIGPLDPVRLGEVHSDNGMMSPSTIVDIMMDDDLRGQFDQWVNDIAKSQTYEISSPASDGPVDPPVML
jgi:hypothetical protein